MKKITILTNEIKKKRVLLLREFHTLRELKWNPVYIRSQHNEFLSEYSRKRGGVVFVDIDKLDKRTIYILCVDDLYFKFNVYKKGLNYISLLIESIEKNKIKKIVDKHKK